MYPAQAFLNSYSYDDLPDQVVAGGVVLSKQDGGGEFGYYYTDGANQIQFATYWLLSGPITNYKIFESSCLVGEYINFPSGNPVLPPILVEDQFANTYNLNCVVRWDEFDFYINVLVNRTSLCSWSSDIVTIYLFNIESGAGGTCNVQFMLDYVDGLNLNVTYPYLSWQIDWLYFPETWNVFYPDGEPYPGPPSKSGPKIKEPAAYGSGMSISTPVGQYLAGFANWSYEVL